MPAKIRTVMIRENPLARVAELVHNERVSRGMSFYAACDAARALRPADAVGPGISKSTWENVERGRNVRANAWADIERVFKWPSGSIRRYVEDNGPEPAPEEVVVEQQATDTGQSLTARFGELSAEEQALVDAMIETLRRRH